MAKRDLTRINLNLSDEIINEEFPKRNFILRQCRYFPLIYKQSYLYLGCSGTPFFIMKSSRNKKCTLPLV